MSDAVAAMGVLEQARFFSGLTRPQLERVAALGRGRSFPQDTRIYTVGDAVDDFYVLADGVVRFTLGLGKRETSAGDRRTFRDDSANEGAALRIAQDFAADRSLVAVVGHLNSAPSRAAAQLYRTTPDPPVLISPSASSVEAIGARTSASEMNDTSIVARPIRSGSVADVSVRALVRSIETTRGSARSDSASWPRPTSRA